jgi:subtilisin family serine protease
MNKVARLFILFSLTMLSCQQYQETSYYSYVDALGQMKATAFREEGLTGKGIKVGIIDLGFSTLPGSSTTRHLMKKGQIAFMRQYYPDSQAVFFNHSEKHGYVITFMVAGQSARDSLYHGGLAINSTLYLAKVGKSAYEFKTLSNEEENIHKALEDFYQRGVRVVNLSLGYWDDFEDDKKNYTRSMMDGKTTRIAEICREYINKGMIIVAAAGNTGEYQWKTIWTPADVEEVVTVGACSRLDVPFRAVYSGLGNPEVDFVKPDLVCYSAWGTSVSTPIITSVIAVMLEKDSTLTPSEVKTILHKSGNLYPYPNNYIGYGIPDAKKVLRLIDQKDYEPSTVKERYITGDSCEIRIVNEGAVLFQKSGPYLVKRQYYLTPKEGKIVVKRKKGIPRSTVVVNNAEVYELFWQ